MKRKIFSVFFALVLVLTLSLVAAPVVAEESATLLSSTGDIGTSNADTITVEVPAGTTLGQIDSIAWSEYLIQGYPPHVDIMLDLNVDGTADEALVFEYALNGHTGDSQPTYGALTGAWYQTFSDDGEGPAVIDGNDLAWLATGPPGGPGIILGTLADWKAGTVDASVDSSAIVLRLEIEVDNYITDCVALVNNIVLGISGDVGPVEMTASSPGEIIAISVSPTSVNFGSLVPGTPSAAQTVTVTNTGNVAADFSATIENESPTGVYTGDPGLEMNEASVAAWLPRGVAPAGTETPSLVLTVPSGTAAGTYTATLVFWAVEAAL